MAVIPRDIWLYIADFIPNYDLRDLIAVNSAFLEIGMNIRYKEVHLRYLGEKTIKYLVHLMDPEVAKRIRVFIIDPRIHRAFLQQSNALNRDRDKGRENIWKRGVDVLMKRVRDNSSSTRLINDPSTGQKYACTLEGLEQALTDAVSFWTNVVEFTVCWWESDSVQQLQSFLPVAWSTFGPSLRKISLAGNLEIIRTLLSASGPLPALQELRLEFTNNIFRVDDQADNAILTGIVAPLISRVSPTLEVLSITSWAFIDLSEFFLKINFLPFLHQLTVRVPFNKAFSVNPDGFTRILRNHSHNLKSVVLRLNPSGLMVDPSKEESLGRWITETSSDPLILANLRSLQIYPTHQDAVFEAFLTYLGRSAETLTDLSIRDRYLNFDEVSAVVTAFSPRPAMSQLVNLRLNVRTLSLHLFDLFEAMLPGLRKLSLYTRDGCLDGSAGEMSLDDVKNGLRQRMYPNWKLYDIGIWQSGSEMDAEVMTLLAGAIPSLRSFWGQGDMSLYISY